MRVKIRLERLTLGDVRLFARLARGDNDPALYAELITVLDRLVEGGVLARSPRDLPALLQQAAGEIAAYLAAAWQSRQPDVGSPRETRPYTAQPPRDLN